MLQGATAAVAELHNIGDGDGEAVNATPVAEIHCNILQCIRRERRDGYGDQRRKALDDGGSSGPDRASALSLARESVGLIISESTIYPASGAVIGVHTQTFNRITVQRQDLPIGQASITIRGPIYD